MLKAHVRMEDMILLSGSLRGPIPLPGRNPRHLVVLIIFSLLPQVVNWQWTGESKCWGSRNYVNVAFPEEKF